jgi:DNA-binding IclR family transcriptional regulator
MIGTEGFPASTIRSIASIEAYKGHLVATRRRGYAIDREELQEGVNGVSAPAFGPEGEVIAILSLERPEFRMTESKIRDCGGKRRRVGSPATCPIAVVQILNAILPR